MSHYGVSAIRWGSTNKEVTQCWIHNVSKEGSDFVVLPVTHAQGDYWHTTPFPQALEHFHTLKVGQAKIEQDHIRMALRGLNNALLAGGGLENPIAVGFEGDTQEAADLRLIVNDERD